MISRFKSQPKSTSKIPAIAPTNGNLSLIEPRSRMWNPGVTLFDVRPEAKALRYPKAFLKSLTNSQRKVIDALLALHYSHENIHPTQTYLGQAIGLGRQRVNEVIGELIKLGLVASGYRHLKSCVYKLSAYFFIPQVIKKALVIFPFLMAFSAEATQLRFNLRSWSSYVYLQVLTNRTTGCKLRTGSTNRVRACATVGFCSTDQKNGSESSIVNQPNDGCPVPEFSNKGEDGKPIVSDSIRNIRSMRLSLAGQIRLSMYDDRAIDFAEKSMRKTSTKKNNPFAYFCKLCNIWNTQNNTEAKPHVAEANRMRLEIPESAPYLLEGQPQPIIQRTVTHPPLAGDPQEITRVSQRKAAPLPTPEEQEAIRAYQRKLRPWEYNEDGTRIERRTVETEDPILLTQEEKNDIVNRCVAVYDSPDGMRLRLIIGEATAHKICEKIIERLIGQPNEATAELTTETPTGLEPKNEQEPTVLLEKKLIEATLVPSAAPVPDTGNTPAIEKKGDDREGVDLVVPLDQLDEYAEVDFYGDANEDYEAIVPILRDRREPNTFGTP